MVETYGPMINTMTVLLPLEWITSGPHLSFLVTLSPLVAVPGTIQYTLPKASPPHHNMIMPAKIGSGAPLNFRIAYRDQGVGTGKIPKTTLVTSLLVIIPNIMLVASQLEIETSGPIEIETSGLGTSAGPMTAFLNFIIALTP